MKTWLKWAVMLIILIVLSAFIFLIYSNIKKERLIQKMNAAGYELLNCMSECPTQVYEENKTWLTQECLDECQGEYSKKAPRTELMKYKNEEIDFILNSQESTSCLQNYKIEGFDGEKYKSCIKQILPVLKNSYNIAD